MQLEDILLIGAKTRLESRICECSHHKFRKLCKDTGAIHPLVTRKEVAIIEKAGAGVSIGYSGSALKQDFTVKRTHKYYSEYLLDKWEHHREFCDIQQLKVLGGILVSLCTRSAMRCTILDLLKTPSIHKLLQLLHSNSQTEDLPNTYWAAFLQADVEELVRLWKEAPCRKEIGDVILGCLKQLRHTGLDRHQKEFYTLWMHEENSEPKRVGLKLKRHSWVWTLQDTEDSCAMAVLVEKCFGIFDEEDGTQSCRSARKRMFPSRLETALLVNSRLPPFDHMTPRRHGRRAEVANGFCIHRDLSPNEANHARNDAPFYDVSNIKPGTHIYIRTPHYRLAVVKPLSNRHLLLKWDPSFRQVFRNAISFSLPQGKGHSELFEREDEGEEPILVHIQHSDG